MKLKFVLPQNNSQKVFYAKFIKNLTSNYFLYCYKSKTCGLLLPVFIWHKQIRILKIRLSLITVVFSNKVLDFM